MSPTNRDYAEYKECFGINSKVATSDWEDEEKPSKGSVVGHLS